MATQSLADLIRNVDPTKSEFALLPPAEYEAIVYEAELTKSKNGNRMFRLKYKVTEGEFKNRTLFHQVTITENNASIAVRQLLASGATDPETIAAALGDEDTALVLCKEMTDTACVVSVKIDDGSNYDGQARNKISNVKKAEKADADALSGKPAEKKEKKASKASKPETPF